jgi:uncharacterized protein (TIGR02391 family)
MATVSDSHVYNSVGFSPLTLNLFMNALRFYADALESDLKTIELDSELAKLLDAKSVRSFPIAREIKEVREMAERTEKMIPQAESMGDAEMHISHGLVRKLKAVSLLYIADLERRRNQIATARALTTYGTQMLDTKLLQLREKLEMGVFDGADPMPLIIAPEAAERPPVAAAAVTTTRPAQGAVVELVDEELRERCLDLFNDFDDAAQSHRFDTVIGEATRVLEDRIRKAGGFGVALFGGDLMTAAFKGQPPPLELSTHGPEQEGAHRLFRGVVAFIRNPVHHRLQTIERERTLQILGFIDYLLHLVDAAKKPAAQTPPTP